MDSLLKTQLCMIVSKPICQTLQFYALENTDSIPTWRRESNCPGGNSYQLVRFGAFSSVGRATDF